MIPSALLRAIASEEALWSAWDDVRASRGTPGVDGVGVQAFERDEREHLRELGRQLSENRYRPRPLRRVWVPKPAKTGEYRPVSVPAVRDRVAARAAHSVLEHVFEPLFHDSSYGFRPGRGALAAIRRLLRLRDQGLKWMARADIDGFFDSIDQRQMFHTLESVLPWDVRRLLLLWTRIRVVDDEEQFRLMRGVPQGTPTSPLLANFVLTPFDLHLERRGCRPSATWTT